MATKIANFRRGDTRRWKFTFEENTGTDEAPVWEGQNITDWIVFVTFKLDSFSLADDDEGVVQVQTTAGDDAGGPAYPDDILNGVVYLVLPSDVSETLLPDETYEYDFQRVIPGTPPDVDTVNAGKVKILQDTTRSTT